MNKWIARTFVFVATVFAVGSIYGDPVFDSGTFRGGPSHPGVAEGKGPREFHGMKWKFATGGRVVSSPVYSAGTIYFGSDDNNLYAVDAQTGRQRWKFETLGPVPSTPAVSADRVFFGSYDGRFYAVDAPTGKLRWKFATAGERRFEAKGLHGFLPKTQTYADAFDVFLSSPVVVGNSVYFGSGDGNLYALDTRSGELRWKFATGNVVHASPAYADGTLYFGSWDAYFYAVDAETGKEKWRFHGGEDNVIHNQVGFQSSPTVANNVVYTGCRDSNVYALDARTGKELWRFNNEMSWVNSTPAVADGKLLFATSDSALFHAIDAQTGKSIYRHPTKAYVFSSPTVAGDVVLLGVLNGTLEARDLKTGELLWEFQTASSRENRLWALTAERKFNPGLVFNSPWRESVNNGIAIQESVGPFYSTPLVVDQTVFVGSGDGYLYALQ